MHTQAEEINYKKKLADLEFQLISLLVNSKDQISKQDESVLRWAFSFARLTRVCVKSNDKIRDVLLNQANFSFRKKLFDIFQKHIGVNRALNLEGIKSEIQDILQFLKHNRQEILKLFSGQFSSDDLDAATRKRPLAIALSGGGGTAYGFVGVFAALEEAGLPPAAIAATSMGAILGAYRARKKNFELRELRNLVAPLSWKHMLLKNFDGHRFGIPAAYRLYLREVIGHEFESNGAFMRIKDLAIPFRACWAGLSEFQLDPADANLLHETDNRKLNITKAVADYAKRPVKAIYIGANETTKEFDVLDTVAFSSAVPGLIHYDIVRDDPRMISLVEELLKKQGVLRVIDGGLADNLPSEQAYLAVQENSDTLEKDPIVLALDSFSPNYRKHLMFLPLMKMAEKTSQRGRAAADMNLAFKKIISPLSIVPTPEELMQAVEWGQEEIKPHMRCLRKLIGPIPEPEGLV